MTDSWSARQAPTRSRFRGWGTSRLLSGMLVVAVLGLSLRLASAQRATAVLVERSNEALRRASVGEVEHSALVATYNKTDWGRPFLRASSVEEPADQVIEEPEDGMYVYVRASCRACSEVLPVLERLSKRAPGRVRLVGLDTSRSDLLHFRRSHQSRIPIVMNPVGGLLDKIHPFATPLTILVRSGQVRAVVTGAIDPSNEAALQRALLSIPTASMVAPPTIRAGQ